MLCIQKQNLVWFDPSDFHLNKSCSEVQQTCLAKFIGLFDISVKKEKFTQKLNLPKQQKGL